VSRPSRRRNLRRDDPNEAEGGFQKELLQNESVDLRKAREQGASGKPVLLDPGERA